MYLNSLEQVKRLIALSISDIDPIFADYVRYKVTIQHYYWPLS